MKNILWLEEAFPGKTQRFTYEELVKSNIKSLTDVLRNMKIDQLNTDFQFHSSSIHKWKADRTFGHRLSSESKEIAFSLGYSLDEISNSKSLIWPMKKYYYRMRFRLK